jgi:hypothetical protein
MKFYSLLFLALVGFTSAALAKGREQSIYCFTPDSEILVSASMYVEGGRVGNLDVGLKVRGDILPEAETSYSQLRVNDAVVGRVLSWNEGMITIYDRELSSYDNTEGKVNGSITLVTGPLEYREVGLICSSPNSRLK